MICRNKAVPCPNCASCWIRRVEHVITEFTRFYRIEVGCQKSVRAKPASYWLKIFRHVISRFTKKGKSKQAFNSKFSQKLWQNMKCLSSFVSAVILQDLMKISSGMSQKNPF